MEKNPTNIFPSIIVIFLLVLLVPFPILGANGACVSYNSSSKTITISCTSETHLNDVNNALNDPTILKKESNGVWLLTANLVVAKGGNMVIDSSDTTWLKIISNGAVGYGLKNSGDLKIDSVKITSWNIASNTYASPGSDGTTPRGYIVASGGGVGKMDILNSELAYLGYTGTGHHGLDYYGSDGSTIQNNHIHHNWRAFYSSQVGGLRFDYNDVHDNLEYGIDPHTATHDMSITFNKSYNNNHGIICSQRCYNLHIENNEIYANNRDGIYLDAGSHHITIANNNIHEEETAIQLPSLSSSEVYGNTITNSKYGIKLYTQIGSDYDNDGVCGSIGCGSTNNNIHDNKITASSTGIEVRGGAASNTFESNTINGATTGRGIVVEGATTSDNVFKSNHISSASYGMRLTSGNTNSRIVDNYFDSVVSSGEYTLASGSTLKVENTKFSSDVIKAVDTTSNPVSISNSGVISVIDGATGKTTNYDTTSQAYTRTLASNAKITVTSTTTGTPADTTPPAQVTGLSVSTVSSSQLNLAWTQSSASDFNHYNIYKSTTSGFTVTPGVTVPTGTSTTNSYSNTGLNPSTKYYYKVAAVDNAGNIGALSSENSGTTAAVADTTPPAQVTGLSVSTVSSSQLNLAWTQSSASDFNHYNVYRGTSSGFSVNPGVTVPTGTPTTNSYSNTGLNPSTKYYYKVAAVDNAGNIGALSSENSGTTAAVADTTPPAQVTGLSVSTVSSSQLNLAWTQSSASDFNHYNVYRGTSSGFSVNPSTTTPIGTSIANSYSSTGLSPSTKYYYKVAAVDNAGNIGALSSENSGTTAAVADTTPPAQVTGLSVSTVSSSQLNLAWTQSSASDFNHYNVYRGTSSGFSVNPGVTVPTGTPTTNSYSNTGLNPSTKYYYKVAAVDNAGNIGALSSENSGTTAAVADTTPPAQVTDLSVSTVSSSQLNLAWTQSSASDFNHYNVYRGTSSGFSVNPGVTVPTGTPTTNSYSNTGLNPSTKYYYKVAAVDNAGNIGALSSENSGTTAAVADTTPPAQVTGLSVSTVSSSQLNLAWTQSSASDFNHYNVYRGTSSGFSVNPGVTVPTGTPTTNSYSNTGLNPSTKYYYKVAAVDNAGNIGALSSENSGTTAAVADTTPPAQVTGLSVSTVSSSQLNLAWTQSSASDFNHYNVYRGTSSGFSVNPSTTTPIGTSIANSYSSTGLSPSTKYYYKVAAVDNAGNIGALSSENSGTTAAVADTTPPAQVTGLSVSTVSSSQLNLAWTQSSASDFNHYNVYRGTSSGFSVNPSTTTPIGTSIANSYSSTGLSPSTKYYYKVAAVDNAGNIGALSSENSGTTAAVADTTPPARVTGLKVSTVSSSQLNLAWTKVTASDFNHYNIYKSTTSGFTVTPGVTVPTGTSTTNSYSNTGLNPSTKYSYRVAAVDNAGNIGALSSQVSKTTAAAAGTTPPSSDTTPPARVTGLSVSTVSSSQLNLAWTKVTASDFNHYNIYKSTTSGFTVTPGVTVPTGTSTTNSYSNTGLNPSTKYSYRVAAVDNAGNIGALSSQVSKTTAAAAGTTPPSSDTTPPAQVTGLSVSTVSSSQLNLAWTKVTASDFNHYNIYKSTTSGFTVTPGVTVPTGTSTTNSYSNTGLNPSTKYSYRVAAVDNAGNIGALSSQVSKTTAAAAGTTPPSSDTTPPAQVTGLSVSTVSSSQLNLAWTKVTASDFNHYNIYKSTTSGFTVTPGVTVPTGTSTTNSYSNTGLNPSTKYSYRVAAVDNAGNIGALSSQVSKTTAAPVGTTSNTDSLSSGTSGTTGDNQGGGGKDMLPPGRVSAVSIKTISHSQLDLKWSTVRDSDLNHYNIYIGTSPKFSVKPGATPPVGTSTTSSYHSTGLNPSAKYYYKVAAVDNAGNIGPLSNTKSGETSDAPIPRGKSTAETTVDIHDTMRENSNTVTPTQDDVRENSNTVTPTQDDHDGRTEPDNTTDIDVVERDTSDESASIDKPM